ncbi:metallophosphoesterase [Ulvibacterium marinum]|uniref:Metallophosphoesterase n=1 Tax=Ulvibacterium marinum TaxID=2419782 RepID=A0A3B0C481_9FLAO|nr:metallophosphoesterase [Ulvibacterium marinum]RKN78737.1 metallophosphoesterase [Ulvibacterium marinum]
MGSRGDIMLQNKMNALKVAALWVALFSFHFLVSQQQPKSIQLEGQDGPYLINDTLYEVSRENKLVKTIQYDLDSIGVSVANQSVDEFFVSIRPKYAIPKSNYEFPEKLIAISDIEGKFDAFAGFLQCNQIIDENFNWIFDKGHLVLVGDFVDRGKNVTQVLWLIYKLEQQAELKGGKVHFVLGNHEVMNFHGDHRYNQGKYLKVAQEISGKQNNTEALKYLYSEKSEIAKWLATKNVIEKIGDYLFVHGGLSSEILNYQLNLKEINHQVRSTHHREDYEKDSVTQFLYSSKGPFWYRGLIGQKPEATAKVQSEIDQVLLYYKAEKMVLGHTVVDSVSKGYKGKIIRIDVSHGYQKFSGETKGLLIEKGIEYIVDDLGNKTRL